MERKNYLQFLKWMTVHWADERVWFDWVDGRLRLGWASGGVGLGSGLG